MATWWRAWPRWTSRPPSSARAAVTGSGSGLDPATTIAGAMYQVPRIAAARGLSQQVVTKLVTDHETGRFLGIFGEPYVNVLDLNLALDACAAHPSSC